MFEQEIKSIAEKKAAKKAFWWSISCLLAAIASLMIFHFPPHFYPASKIYLILVLRIVSYLLLILVIVLVLLNCFRILKIDQWYKKPWLITSVVLIALTVFVIIFDISHRSLPVSRPRAEAALEVSPDKIFIQINSMITSFRLWLEFEEADPGSWDIENDFCNIHVYLPDGRTYGINVWTYEYFQTSINDDIKTGENLSGLYQTPPDLLVKELTRDCIERTIRDLLEKGDLEQMLNPSVVSRT